MQKVFATENCMYNEENDTKTRFSRERERIERKNNLIQ